MTHHRVEEPAEEAVQESAPTLLLDETPTEADDNSDNAGDPPRSAEYLEVAAEYVTTLMPEGTFSFLLTSFAVANIT
jgi:hypothetical protein